MSVLVVGSVALDSIETPAGRVEDVLGGSAIYFALAARLFTSVQVVGAVGSDFPREHIRFLSAKGIDLKGLQVEQGASFRWKGRYGNNPNEVQTVSTELNVLGNFLPLIPERYRQTRYLFLANIDPSLQLYVLERMAPYFVACDSMNFWIENKRKALISLLGKVDISIFNDLEACSLSGERNLVKSAKAIITLGAKRVLIKKGEHGAFLFSEGAFFNLPAYPLEEVVDPTGAGDTFAGGFIGFLSQSDGITQANMRKAVAFGTVLASYTVEDFGVARLGILTREEIERRYEALRSLTHF